jgi:threonine/homoserine/homoserine lactone efflux protein
VEQLLPFLAISALVIVTPGPDTLLTVNTTLAGGRRAGLATAAGVAAGQGVWTLATAVGISALLVASEPVFLAVKVAGAAYLAYIGLRAVWSALRGSLARAATGERETRRELAPAFRRGLLSNLGNPKMAVFFPSLLPQFVPASGALLPSTLALGLAFCLKTLGWLSGYAFVVARAGDVLRRGRLGRWLEGLAGSALVLLGIGLALEPRRT